MNDVIAQRAARIAFGIVLLVGTGLLVQFLYSKGASVPAGVHAWHIVVGSWALAAVAACLVWAVVVVLPRARHSDALRRAALSVPAVGIALLLPITLHLPFAMSDLNAFDEWSETTMYVVGHTHIIFAVLVWLRARSLTGLSRTVTVKRIYRITCISALFPLWIPAIVVAITGIPIAKLLARMERIAEADREASRDIPFAIARTA